MERASSPPPPASTFRVRPGIILAASMGLLGATVAGLVLWQAFHVKPTSVYLPGSGGVVPSATSSNG